MALTIDNGRTRIKVWELAALMGESHADAIDKAIRERLEREKTRLRDLNGDEAADEMERKARSLALQELGRHASVRLRHGPSAVEIGDYLYDENGLPK